MFVKLSPTQLKEKNQQYNRYLAIKFEADFPEIADFSLELKVWDYGMPAPEPGESTQKTITRSMANFRPIVCSDEANQFCYGGGFDLLSVLRQMVLTRETHRHIYESCPGHFYNYTGKACMVEYRGEITITYKTDEGNRAEMA